VSARFTKDKLPVPVSASHASGRPGVHDEYSAIVVFVAVPAVNPHGVLVSMM
jgi:hypothetical protein